MCAPTGHDECQGVWVEFYPHYMLCYILHIFKFLLNAFFFFNFSCRLAQFSAMSHKNPLLLLWEEVEIELSGVLATDDDLDHINQRS